MACGGNEHRDATGGILRQASVRQGRAVGLAAAAATPEQCEGVGLHADDEGGEHHRPVQAGDDARRQGEHDDGDDDQASNNKRQDRVRYPYLLLHPLARD